MHCMRLSSYLQTVVVFVSQLIDKAYGELWRCEWVCAWLHQQLPEAIPVQVSMAAYDMKTAPP